MSLPSPADWADCVRDKQELRRVCGTGGAPCQVLLSSGDPCLGAYQGALKGTNLIRGQTEPKRRFSLIFADSRLFQENK